MHQRIAKVLTISFPLQKVLKIFISEYTLVSCFHVSLTGPDRLAASSTMQNPIDCLFV